MNKLYQEILWYTFGIIVAATIAQENNEILIEKYNNTINLAGPNNMELKNNVSLSRIKYLHIKNIKEDIKSMIKVFDKIDNIFEKFNEKEETCCVHRHRRFTSQRSECRISKHELLEMKNELENILHMQDPHFVENNCNFNMERGDCVELINLMKCGIHHLKNHFMEITTLNDVSTNDFSEWKVKYEKLNKVYLKLTDDLNKSNAQKYKLKLDDLNQEFQHLKQIVSKLEEDLKAANENIKQITIEFCSSEIHSKRVEQCVNKLKQLKNINYTEIINKIIDRSFMYVNNTELIIVEYIIDFINEQYSIFKYHGYEYLYDKMNIRGYLTTPYVLTFASKVQNYQKHELQIYVKNKIDEWSNKIISGNHWQINTFAEKQDLSFCYYLKDLIKTAYANNINNAKNIIYFLDNLPTIKQRALGYYHLFNEIKSKHGFNGDEIIMLVYRINEILNQNSKFNQLEFNVARNLETIQSEIPSWLQAILWDNSVSIISKFNNYKLVSLHKYFGYIIYTETILAICPAYMDGADKWKITGEDKGSYFKVKNIANNHDEEYYWKINAHNNGENLYFVNKNTGNKLYTKDTIGGWSGFWYSIPKDCYQVYEDFDNERKFQKWIIY